MGWNYNAILFGRLVSVSLEGLPCRTLPGLLAIPHQSSCSECGVCQGVGRDGAGMRHVYLAQGYHFFQETMEFYPANLAPVFRGWGYCPNVAFLASSGYVKNVALSLSRSLDDPSWQIDLGMAGDPPGTHDYPQHSDLKARSYFGRKLPKIHGRKLSIWPHAPWPLLPPGLVSEVTLLEAPKSSVIIRTIRVRRTTQYDTIWVSPEMGWTATHQQLIPNLWPFNDEPWWASGF